MLTRNGVQTVMVMGMVLSLAVLGPASLGVEENGSAPSIAQDKLLVEGLAQEFVDFYAVPSGTSLERLEEILDDDFMQATMSGKLVRGKGNNLHEYRTMREGKDADTRVQHVRYEIESVRVSGDMAWVFGLLESEGRGKKLNKAFGRSIWETLVFAREGGQWRLVFEQSAKANAVEAARDGESSLEWRADGVGHSFEGLGIKFEMVREGALLERVFAGSVAEAAGLRDGEVILKAGDRSLAGLTTEQALGLLKGPAGSEVQLGVRSGTADVRVVKLVRGMSFAYHARGRMLDEQVGLIELTTLTAPSREYIGRAIEEFVEAGATGLILDLRSNGSGDVAEAKQLAELFLDPGEVLWQAVFTGKKAIDVKCETTCQCRLPMVVLVGEGTQRAAELVASALQSSRRARLVGTRTAGVVALRERVGEGKESRLVDRGDYLTAKGKPIKGTGVTADVRVRADAGEEQVLRRAMRILRKE